METEEGGSEGYKCSVTVGTRGFGSSCGKGKRDSKILQVRAVECGSVEMRGKRFSRLGEGVRGMNKERRKVENWVLAKIL